MMLLLATLAHAADLTVCDGPACDHPNVDAALAAAGDGDTIWLGPTPIALPWRVSAPINRTLTIRSWAGPGRTALSTAGSPYLADVGPGNALVLHGLRLTSQARLLRTHGGSIEVTSSRLSAADLSPDQDRGGLIGRVEGGRLTVANSRLSDAFSTILNDSASGGAFEVSGGRLELIDSELSAGSAFVGGLVAAHGTGIVELRRSVVTDGLAVQGGAVWVGRGATLVADGVGFSENRATTGGAIYAATGATVRLTDTHFDNNVAGSALGLDDEQNLGGAVACTDCTLWVDGSRFASNEAFGGAGLVVNLTDPDAQASLACADPAESGGDCAAIQVSNSTFFENDAQWAAAIDIKRRSTRDPGPRARVALNDLRVIGNTANSDAGGLWAGHFPDMLRPGPVVDVQRSVFLDNHAGSSGGGLWISAHATQGARLTDVLFCGNHAQDGGGSAAFFTGGPVQVRRGVTFNNTSGVAGGTALHFQSTPVGVLGHGLDDSLLAWDTNPNPESAALLTGQSGLKGENNVFLWTSLGPAYLHRDGPPVPMATSFYGGPLTDQPIVNDLGQSLTPTHGSTVALTNTVTWNGVNNNIRCNELNVRPPTPHLLRPTEATLAGPFRDPAAATAWIDDDRDGAKALFDCDDHDLAVHPNAMEQCNGIDDDCDGLVDDLDPNLTGGQALYVDADADGFVPADAVPVLGRPGAPDEQRVACAPFAGAAPMGTLDCDDGDARIAPGQPEIAYNGVDDDCDRLTPDVPPDADADGFRADEDCDDDRADVNPSATEVCDDIDNDCDGDIDEDDEVLYSTWYPDVDGDGYGTNDGGVSDCAQPRGLWSERDGDCAPEVDRVHPGASEVCDDIDNDCDGQINNDATDAPFWYLDGDGDGFGDPTTQVRVCEAPGDAWVSAGDDCDDADPSVNGPPCPPPDSGDSDPGDDSDSGDSDPGDDSGDTEVDGIVVTLTGGAGCVSGAGSASRAAPLWALLALATLARRRSA